MGLSRTRPSRVVFDTSLTTSDLPNATSGAQRSTFEITGLPTRGIIHAARLIITKSSALSSTGSDVLVIHTSGTASAGTTTDLPAADIQSTLTAISFAQRQSSGGSPLNNIAIPTGVYIMSVNMLEQLVYLRGTDEQSATSLNFGPVAYDVSSGVLGPDANDGKLYVTFVSGQANYTTMASAKIVLEIEPSY